MFFHTILAFSLFLVSNAVSVHHVLDSDIDPQPYLDASTNTLGPVTQLRIVNKRIEPDGHARSTVLANGVYPAPLIKAVKNGEFSIRVVNELADPTMPLETSIHWHGIFQHKTPWADGATYVTQCPIRQNEAYEYRFNAVGQSGTYWYHSHYLAQYCDGLRGPLVIYDPDDPLRHLYDVDDETTVITLSDWYHTPSIKLGNIFQAVTSNSTLINGRGRYPGGPPTPFSVIKTEQGLRYRFRIVSMSCHPSFNFTIDRHRMTIIEVDGNEVFPVDVDWLVVHAGQRYSVVITADRPVGNYWIRALRSDSVYNFEGGLNMAILRYVGALEEDPRTEAGPHEHELAFNEANLHPLLNPAAPGIPEIGKADVNIQLHPGINHLGLFTFNNVTFVNPPVPVLLQILSGKRHPSQLLPKGSIYELPRNKVIEISFPNPTDAPGGPHPIHLHGHSFSVVRVAGSNMSNFVDPVRRDVVSIGNSETDDVTIRFITDNPGPWYIHCHIDWHFHHGLAVVLAEATAQTAKNYPPLDWLELCIPAEPGEQTFTGLLGS